MNKIIIKNELPESGQAGAAEVCAPVVVRRAVRACGRRYHALSGVRLRAGDVHVVEDRHRTVRDYAARGI